MFHFDVEQVLKGEPCSDERIQYHYLMREMHWSYEDLVKTPYRVVVCQFTILDIEGKVAEFNRKRSENHGNTV